MDSDLKEKLFDTTVRVYLKTAKPVGSKILAKRYFKELSPSAIRVYLSELVAEELLENIGFSLGRAPTDLGWRRFLEKNSADNSLSRQSLPAGSLHQCIRSLAEQTRNVFLVEVKGEKFIEGLRATLSQPEFSSQDTAAEFLDLIEAIFNETDVMMRKVHQLISIFIGQENPLTASSKFSLMVLRQRSRLLVMAGPKRMDYPYNYRMIKTLQTFNYLNI